MKRTSLSVVLAPLAAFAAALATSAAPARAADTALTISPLYGNVGLNPVWNISVTMKTTDATWDTYEYHEVLSATKEHHNSVSIQPRYGGTIIVTTQPLDASGTWKCYVNTSGTSAPNTPRWTSTSNDQNVTISP